MAFQNPQLLALLLLLPIFILVWVWRGMRTVPSALVLRLLAIALMVVALANPGQSQQTAMSGPLVILVDQSDSLTPEGQATLRAEVRRMVGAIRKSAEDQAQRVVVLWFGGDAVAAGEWAEARVSDEPPAELVEALDPTATDLAGALRTAREMLAPLAADMEDAGQIVLLSDGLQTSGDALAEAQLAAEAGLQIDVLPLDVARTPELWISSMSAPRSLHVSEEYTVDVVVTSTIPEGGDAASKATLRLWDGDQLLEESSVQIEPGENRFTSGTLRATSPGVARLRAEIVGDTDTFEQNNHAGATALVAPPPRVLLVEGRPDNASELASALWNAGVESEVIAANRIPTRMSSLARFDGMVLVDVPAHELSFDQMTSVKEFVRSEGRGLVATGGTNSFGLGAYDDTPLEDVLPVDMEAPPRPQRAEVALLLIIDRSASMDTAIGVSKFDMAKEAAILSTESLRSEDSIGVLAFDTGQQWTVPFQRIGEGVDLKQIQDNIAMLPTGGGTDIYNALALGVSELRQQGASVRHVVLLTDGRSFTDDRVAYQQLAESALAEDITISTIAIGFDSDTELLDSIASWGGGRYYFADDPEDIPRLTLQESEIARSDPSVEGEFFAELEEVHPLLRDFAPADLPPLSGYVSTTPKEAAEVVLRSPESDPVLSSWQYGLGRAVAWTPSVSEPWANNWLDWQNYGRFWAQIIRYTLPEADSGNLQVSLTPQPGGARLVADAVQENGAPLDLADAVAQMTLPDGTEQAFYLRQVAPGRYAQDLLLPANGPYEVLVVLDRGGELSQTETGYVQQVSAEYVPPRPDRDRLQGEPLLREMARLSGGEMLQRDVVLRPAEKDQEDDRATGNAIGPLWMWLLGAALVVWVLEIAVRRGLFMRDR